MIKIAKLCLLTTLSLLSFKVLADDPTTVVTPDLTLVKQIQHIEDTKIHADLDVSFPLLNGKLTPTDKQFNQVVVNLMNTEMTRFKKDVVEFNAMSLNGTTDIKLNSSLNLEYFTNLITTKNNQLISIRFSLNEYMLGAAHPNQSYRVLNYNLSTGQPIQLSDLFNPKANYIKTLTNYSLKILSKRLNSSPEELRPMMLFNNWNLRKDGLLISFDEFPHAIEDQTVIIPYSVIKKIMAKDSVVYDCVIGQCH